jgi:sulfatase maturation enzyme AslB (radical SAM superfamily)
MASEFFSIIITTQCNLSCSYCYQNARAARSAEWDAVQAGIDLAFRRASSQIELLFLGGEPLLEFDLIRRAVSYTETLNSDRKRARFALCTNGTLISDFVADYLDEYEFDIRLSFDGVQQAQGFRGSGTFNILDGILDSLRSRHPQLYKHRLQILLTVIPETVHFLAESVNYLLQKDIRQILISPCITPYPARDKDGINELDAEFARVAENSLNHLQHSGTVPVAILRKAGNEIPRKGERHPPCRALTGDSLTMDLDGLLYTCPLLVESYQIFPSGSLMEQASSLKIGDVRDPEARKRRAALGKSVPPGNLLKALASCGSSYGNCSECEHHTQCIVCPVSVWQGSNAAGPYRVPDFVCAFNRVAIKYRDRFPSIPEAYERFFPESGASDPIRRLGNYLHASRSRKPDL